MTTISPEEVRGRRARGEALVLLDCREADELRVARIDGAVHAPLSEFPRHVAGLDPAAEYVVFCHHGVRSQRAAAYLREQGFASVMSMSGGIDAWSVQVDAGVPRYR